MWYAMMDLESNYHRESRIFFGEELQLLAAELTKVCDEAMQFDMAEMTFDEAEDYETEGYENYEALQHPTAELLSDFWFRCNDVQIRIAGLAEGWDAFRGVFDAYAKGNKTFKNWTLAENVNEEAFFFSNPDAELQQIAEGETEGLQFFVRR